jgi:hypothetical protein
MAGRSVVRTDGRYQPHELALDNVARRFVRKGIAEPKDQYGKPFGATSEFRHEAGKGSNEEVG